MFDAKIKLRTATIAPNIICLFLSDGEVNGSGSITIEKKITVGLRKIVMIVFADKFPKEIIVRIV